MFPQPSGNIGDTENFIKTSMEGLNAGTNLQLVIEESEDLTSWTKRETIDVTIPVEEDEKTKFLRFKIKE